MMLGTLASRCQTARCHSPEIHSLNLHRLENFKRYVVRQMWNKMGRSIYCVTSGLNCQPNVMHLISSQL
jgi:hypothetical protein